MSSGDTAFWSPRAPALRANVSHPVTWENGERLDLSMFYKQALASVLRLTIRTTPVPYLVNAQIAATVRCVVTRRKS